MKLIALDENTWVYPDIVPEEIQPDLQLARGGHTGLILWTDSESEHFSLSADLPEGVKVLWHQLRPTLVDYNSGVKNHVSACYDDVKDFVTREAPFSVYDITVPIKDPSKCRLSAGQKVFFLRLEADRCTEPRSTELTLHLKAARDSASITLLLTVHKAQIPSLHDTESIIQNWLTVKDICFQHHVKENSDEFWALVDQYLDRQQEIRCNHFLLPSPKPVFDENGKLIAFDISVVEKMGRMALAKGFRYIYGHFCARFRKWREPEVYLEWNPEIEVRDPRAYWELKLYFDTLWEMVCRNGWQKQYFQGLEDEAQTASSDAYHTLSSICRQCMPGIFIHDPIECQNALGAADMWCLKQKDFDTNYAEYKALQAAGIPMTIYSCGFPANKWMNRSTDLPLLAGRYMFWIAAKEGFLGYLHWGYNNYGNLDPVQHNCLLDEGHLLPPGDSFIVYPGDGCVYNSLRAQIQLFGAEDMELLKQLPKEKAYELAARLCTNCFEYDIDIRHFQAVRSEVLQLLSE